MYCCLPIRSLQLARSLLLRSNSFWPSGKARSYRLLDPIPDPAPPPVVGPAIPILSSLLLVIICLVAGPDGAAGSVLPCLLAFVALVPAPPLVVAVLGCCVAPVMRCILVEGPVVVDDAVVLVEFVAACWLLVARICCRYAARTCPGD